MISKRLRTTLNIFVFGGALLAGLYGGVCAQRQEGDRRDTYGARNGELSDRRIASEVRRAIWSDAALAAAGAAVRVSAFNGVVTLTGGVASETQRRLIQAKAVRIVGPSRVDNEILVR